MSSVREGVRGASDARVGYDGDVREREHREAEALRVFASVRRAASIQSQTGPRCSLDDVFFFFFEILLRENESCRETERQRERRCVNWR